MREDVEREIRKRKRQRHQQCDADEQAERSTEKISQKQRLANYEVEEMEKGDQELFGASKNLQWTKEASHPDCLSDDRTNPDVPGWPLPGWHHTSACCRPTGGAPGPQRRPAAASRPERVRSKRRGVVRPKTPHTPRFQGAAQEPKKTTSS